MSYLLLIEVLDQLGIPVAYNHFNEPTSLPFITVTETEPDYIFADDINFYEKEFYEVEYYFRHKDPEKEKEIEQLFKDNHIIYVNYGDIWISDERIYQKIYEVTI